MKQIRIGMLGYGSMGRVHHYALDTMHHIYPNDDFCAQIVRLSARSEDTLSLATSMGIGSVTKDINGVVCADDIDVVDICTPNLYHYEAAKAAITAGKHVYCEKPLAVTAEQAQELAALAKKHGVTTQVVFNNRFMPGIYRAKHLCDSGALGRILTFRCSYLHASCTDPARPAGWKQDRDICGGGVWFDLGSHAVDLIYHLCGEIASIEGHAQIGYPERTGGDGKLWQTNADEAFYAYATLKNGACGTIEANKLALGANDDLRVEIYGEKGSLRYSLMNPNFLEYYDGTRPTGDFGGERGFCQIECVSRFPASAYALGGQKAPVGWLRGHMECYHAFLTAVAQGKPTHPDFADAAHVQWALQEAYRH